ncbi:SemiSWEET transporter [Pseudodesulfovibrio sp.]|uniref:SemiSWEET family sugar transporter n=1 Tax=Pseudodesulfovibrio sp. TaxID=2035812 RepID=UPI002624F665|nr:SemiSWEET transporter [Pseudodesulfovibrio sp.]MDD3313818.1 SemiSWEET transporter [Pseudodesulfovibrio sp.]
MERELVEALGIVAGCCTTAAFAPQVVRTWRTRSVADISLGMYGLFCLGVALWLVYGLLADSLSVILANGATLVLALAVLVMKLRFGRKGRQPLDGDD